jgi:nicotinamide-nucleotide amidase
MREDLNRLANVLLKQAKRAGLTIVTAESCTAGLLAQTLSDAEGAAEHFHGAFVTYTKGHKTCALGVPGHVLHEEGAICGTVARAMADGALLHSTATLAVAITGVAGPEPDEDGNPVGRVCIAVARRGAPTRDFEKNYCDIGRDAIREHAVADALRALIDAASATSAAA